MQIAVDRTAEVLPGQLSSLEVELEAADQIDVERVQVGQEGLQAQPAPFGDTPAQPLAAALVAQVVKRYTIVRVWHLDRRGVRGGPVEIGDELPGGLREVAPDLEDWNELPFRWKRGIERAERVGDAAPFLDRRVSRITSMDDVPDETAHDSNAFLSRHRASAGHHLQLAQLLHFERGDRADDAGGEGKGARDDAACLHRRLERAASHFRAQGLEERVTRLSDAAGQHHRVRIEDVEQVRDTRAKKARGLADDLSRRRIAALRRLVDGLGGDLAQVAAHHADQDRLALVAAQRFPRALRDRGPRRIRLEASVVPAFAAASGGVDRGVTDLSSDVGCAVIQFTLEDYPTADSGSQSHADHVSTTDCGPTPELTERRAIGIVVERGFEMPPARDLVAQRKILPAEVGGHDDDALIAMERSRRSDAHAQKIRPLGARFRHRLSDHLLDHSGDSIDNRGSSTFSECRRRVHRDLAAAIERHRARDDVGATQIHSDDVTLLHVHTATAWLRTSASKLEMYSGVSSRMQRQCRSGHRCGPCRSHGRQARLSCPATAFRPARGPNPNSGTVGPKIVTVGVPIADARCCGAESFVTIARARPMSSADASSGRTPTALITVSVGSASVISAAISESAFDPMMAIL